VNERHEPLPDALLADQRVLSRFRSRIDRRGPDECWRWGNGTKRRYGVLSVQLAGVKRCFTAHRYALALKLGHWPSNFACHKCDYPPCVNPAHLFEGTHLDNMRDKVAKGRQHDITRLGAKLSDEDVAWMRWARAYSGTTYKSIGAAYGLSMSAANLAVRGVTYRCPADLINRITES
jgi:hypothetical protein